MLSLFLSITASVAAECNDVSSLPEAIQIAWISPVQEQARAKEMIEVVRLQDLQQWMDTEQADAKQVLHHLGMLPKRSRRTIDPDAYKIVIFDVESDSLCRSIEQSDDSSITTINGLAVCTDRAKPAKFYSRYGYTGCGYTWNTQAQLQGLDAYRISWQEASKWGFCVLPLSRFLLGAPK